MLLKAEFKDIGTEQLMLKNGYVLIPGLLNNDEVNTLVALYRSLHPTIDPGQPMWNTLYNLNESKAGEVSESILSVIHPKLAPLMKDFVAPVASFMSKNPVNGSVCHLHRDYSILDETKFEYRNLWIPLVDVTENNGALFALPGSHKKFDYPLPMFCKWPYEAMEQELLKQVEVFNVKAGDMVVYADRTLHGSYPNVGNFSRPVVHGGLLHPQYDLCYYYLDPHNQVKVFKVPYSFFFENNFGDQTGRFPLSQSFQFSPPVIEAQDALS